MKRIWKPLITKIVMWLAAELILTSLGMDTLADYGEFVFDARSTLWPSALAGA